MDDREREDDEDSQDSQPKMIIRERPHKGDKDYQDTRNPRERKDDQDYQNIMSPHTLERNDVIPDWGIPLSSDRDLRWAKTDKGVALPSGRNLPPLDPIHKAVILYFTFFAWVASHANLDDTECIALVLSAHYPASEILEEVYNLHVPPDSIQAYFGHVTTYAKNAGYKWDNQKIVAEIMSRLVKDLKTFDAVVSVLVNHRNNENLSLSARWFIWKVYGATGGASRESNTPKVLRDRLSKVFNSNAPDLLGYQDPEIKQSLSIQTAASTSNYRCYDALKKHLDRIGWTPNSED